MQNTRSSFDPIIWVCLEKHIHCALVSSFPGSAAMSHLSSLMDDAGAKQGRVKEPIPQKTRSTSDSFG